MLAARIQPTYLTNVCQAGFKNCSVTNDMDYCAHLLHDCIVTRNFTQPAAIKITDEPEALPLTFTDKENKSNQRRCKKQKFYALFFQNMSEHYSRGNSFPLYIEKQKKMTDMFAAISVLKLWSCNPQGIKHIRLVIKSVLN